MVRYPTPTVCRIRVHRGSAGTTIIVATKLAGENGGTSITNAAEVLATELERRHCPDPSERMLWVEQYPPRVETFAARGAAASYGRARTRHSQRSARKLPCPSTRVNVCVNVGEQR